MSIRSTATSPLFYFMTNGSGQTKIPFVCGADPDFHWKCFFNGTVMFNQSSVSLFAVPVPLCSSCHRKYRRKKFSMNDLPFLYLPVIATMCTGRFAHFGWWKTCLSAARFKPNFGVSPADPLMFATICRGSSSSSADDSGPTERFKCSQKKQQKRDYHYC